MSHTGTARRISPLRRGIGLGLVMLFGAVLWAGNTLGRDRAPAPEPDRGAGLDNLRMIVRGPDEPMVGQRCTIEVFLLNTGTAALKNLELHAKLDAHMEQDSKEREHRAAVAAIESDDVQVVRLHVTPRKVGPGGIDFTLRARNGATEQVRQVWPVAPEGAVRPEKSAGVSPLLCKITTLTECLADRPGIVLVQVVNTDHRAMHEKLDLIVNYGSMGRAGQMLETPNITATRQLGGFGRGGAMPVASNPTRQVKVALPVLAAGESWTIPVRLTPRRIGDLGIAVTTVPATKEAGPQVLATTRLQVKFDPRMAAAELVPQRAGATVPTRLPRTLAEVPEVSIEDPCPPNLKAEEAFEHVAHLIEKINHVNTGKRDAFVEALVSRRSDLRGLPFAMGDDCRLSPERGQHFLNELSVLRQAMTNPAQFANGLPGHAGPATELALRARIAALVQVTGPEGSQLNQQAVQYLASVEHPDATAALARLAVFAEDEAARQGAVAALAKRRDKVVTDTLVGGLNYPWPAVAERAADAIVKLDRKDLLPNLIETLERPDPRAPQTVEKEGKSATVVREMVRVNHLRNCLLCHPPMDAARGTAPPGGRGLEEGLIEGRKSGLMVANGLTAPVPLPGQQLPVPTPSGGYGQFTVPDTLLAFDTTYLRQDFSVKLPVDKAQPWPEQQRFDFLVRTREVTAREAEAYRALLRTAQEGDQTPYQRAAHEALRKLTGRDAEPTAAAWRQALAQK